MGFNLKNPKNNQDFAAILKEQALLSAGLP